MSHQFFGFMLLFLLLITNKFISQLVFIQFQGKTICKFDAKKITLIKWKPELSGTFINSKFYNFFYLNQNITSETVCPPGN